MSGSLSACWGSVHSCRSVHISPSVTQPVNKVQPVHSSQWETLCWWTLMLPISKDQSLEAGISRQHTIGSYHHTSLMIVYYCIVETFCDILTFAIKQTVIHHFVSANCVLKVKLCQHQFHPVRSTISLHQNETIKHTNTVTKSWHNCCHETVNMISVCDWLGSVCNLFLMIQQWMLINCQSQWDWAISLP